MLAECLDIFEKYIEKETDKVIFDNYILDNGIYILIQSEDKDIKKWKEVYRLEVTSDNKMEYDSKHSFIQRLCYFSDIINSRKSLVQPEKSIFSNQYNSFFLKKYTISSENIKKSNKTIEKYFDILKNIEKKYKNKSSEYLYKFILTEIGEVDYERIENIKKWVLENIYKLGINTKQKDYLKIFFIKNDEKDTLDMFENEYKRYLIPNIFNKKDYNIKIKEEVYGLPNNNITLNKDKKYLPNNTRKISTPYLVNLNKAILQKKFFDFLVSSEKKKKGFIYFHELNNITSVKEGELERIEKGFLIIIKKNNEGEVEINDYIQLYRPIENNLNGFIFRNILNCKSTIEYGEITKKTGENGLEKLISDVFFYNTLLSNYRTYSEEIKRNLNKDIKLRNFLIENRKGIFEWIYLGEEKLLIENINKNYMKIIKYSLSQNDFNKAVVQFNLLYSLIDYFRKNNRKEKNMAKIREILKNHYHNEKDWDFENEDEYYFAIGQVIAYILSKRNTNNKSVSEILEFLETKNIEKLKEKLIILMKRYGYYIDIKKNARFNDLYSRILTEESFLGKISEKMILAGFLSKNLFYEKKNENKTEGSN